MGIYGDAANHAARLIKGGGLTPREAWDEAMQLVSESRSSRKKSCPRVAFLTLCETGAVEGVSAGDYTSADKNKPDVLRALKAVRSNVGLLKQRRRLWEVATAGTKKEQNGQLDVLQGLWQEGRLR